jgi:hypothetical protein
MIERGTIGVRHTPPSYSRFSPRAPEIPSLRPDGADGFNAHAFPGFHPGLFSCPPSGRGRLRYGRELTSFQEPHEVSDSTLCETLSGRPHPFIRAES